MHCLKALKRLQDHCLPKMQRGLHYNSRIHPLPSFQYEGAACYIKRDDELSFGISGSKWRKYLSLVPWIQTKNEEVALLGSAHSNHILSIAQILNEKQIPFTLFLQGPPPPSCTGNHFFLSLLSHPKDWVWLDFIPASLPHPLTIELERKMGKVFNWIPMGGSHEASLSGCLTLLFDILRNEEEEKCHFDHIFIDSGTGMIASALLLGLTYIKKRTKLHIVQMAGTKDDFENQLVRCHDYLERLLSEKIEIPAYDSLIFPYTARSFGSINGTVANEIILFARKEGIFLDPMYNAKLMITGKHIIETKKIKGNILFIHSGGALSLSGFFSFFQNRN